VLVVALVPVPERERGRVRVLERVLALWESVDRRCRTLLPQSIRPGFPSGALDGLVSPEPPGTRRLGWKNG
jgi:hypothetical protein